MRPIKRVEPGVQAARVVVLIEPRHDGLGDDALRERVGNRAFEPVADLDAQAAIVVRDDEHDAVVDAAAADAPLLGHAQRVFLDRLGRRRRHEQHGDLAALARLECRELVLEAASCSAPACR